jgi:hypothetical protein
MEQSIHRYKPFDIIVHVVSDIRSCKPGKSYRIIIEAKPVEGETLAGCSWFLFAQLDSVGAASEFGLRYAQNWINAVSEPSGG